MVEERHIHLKDRKRIPLYHINTLIVGSGAAGLNCAEYVFRYLEERGTANPRDHVAIATNFLGGGTSNNSGSDKQTYYRLNVLGGTADCPLDFAKTLTAGGCMHGDLALIEGENSARSFYHLVENGVPFPHTPHGSFVGYKTDHDPRQRATSAGPWTSRFMYQKSLVRIQRYGIKIFHHLELISILTDGSGSEKQVIGAVFIDRSRREEPHHGLTVIHCRNLVVATGGPGDMYEISVYPLGQMGSHGCLFEAGAVAHNLTESQFGLASVDPRWNVSGTYQQVIPRYFSTRSDGSDPQEFLNPYFPSMRSLATNIFLKGYQWPFDPDRLTEYRSSLVDMLVHNEVFYKGRRVFMDFRENPRSGSGLREFSLEDLEPEARNYLVNSGALQDTPIQRLLKMNPLSIDLYTQRGRDLFAEPLEVSVCSQHNNGGFKVGPWWESTIRNLFIIGELAGTHGVKRPGGSALNSGQVGALRAAEYIVFHCFADLPAERQFRYRAKDQIQAVFERIERFLRQGESASLGLQEAKREIQHRMTEHASQIRRPHDVRQALSDAAQMRKRIEQEGLRLEEKKDFLKAWQIYEMALTSEAYLTAIQAMIARGGGSRGSHLITNEKNGIKPHPMLGDEWNFLPENKDLRGEVLEVSWDGESRQFVTSITPVRPIPEKQYWFENTWEAYRSGRIYGELD
ncbi:MAG TPA: FAD-binding protein [bacterium]|nr:FAD-binding protein [bacterium]